MSYLFWLFLPFLVVFILFPYIKYSLLRQGKISLNSWEKIILSLYQLIIGIIILEGLVIVLPLTILASLFVSDRRSFFHRQGRFWTNLFLFSIGLKIKFAGLENLPPTSAIYVQNFQNYLDGAVTLAKLPFAYRFIYQSHVFEAPILGWLERASGYLALEMDDLSLMHRDVVEILRVLKQGESICAFAERGKVGEGVAFFALHSQLPVVPIGIIHKTTAPQVGAFFIKPFPYEIIIKVGKPITSSGKENIRENREVLRGQIEKQLTDLRG